MQPFAVKFCMQSDVGGRSHNEDAVYAHEHPKRDIKVFAVADGMGGHKAGEIASKMAINALSEFFTTDETDVSSELRKIILSANQQIYKASSNPKYAGMGTTLTVAVLQKSKLYLCHVGDSRAYIIKNGTIMQLTEDHSLVANLVKLGQITPEEARVHPRRNIITRALGTQADVEVDTIQMHVKPNDIILLCTDGLTNYVEDAEILAIVAKYNISQVCDKLVNIVNIRNGSDNISIIAIQLLADRGASGERITYL
jgi:protein phosphatase